MLIASRGAHTFWAQENHAIKDIRRVPIRFAGYSIGYRRQKGRPPFTWHPSVRIERIEYGLLKGQFTALAVRLTTEELGGALRSLPFEPYAPVRRQ